MASLIIVIPFIGMAFGLVMAKCLGVRNNWAALGVSPLLGLAWIGFICFLFAVVG